MCCFLSHYIRRLSLYAATALQELLQIFQSASHPSRFVFCSSIASVGVAPSPVKEEASTDFAHAGATGYGQSKWVAERLCQAASDRVTVARVGQLCGDTEHGIWNETEAWPLLVRTADEVGCLPSSGPVRARSRLCLGIG